MAYAHETSVQGVSISGQIVPTCTIINVLKNTSLCWGVQNGK